MESFLFLFFLLFLYFLSHSILTHLSIKFTNQSSEQGVSSTRENARHDFMRLISAEKENSSSSFSLQRKRKWFEHA